MADTRARVDTESDLAPDLRPFAGEWVVIQDEAVIEHGPDLPAIAEKARARGVERPRVLYVEPRDPDAEKLGL